MNRLMESCKAKYKVTTSLLFNKVGRLRKKCSRINRYFGLLNISENNVVKEHRKDREKIAHYLFILLELFLLSKLISKVGRTRWGGKKALVKSLLNLHLLGGVFFKAVLP